MSYARLGTTESSGTLPADVSPTIVEEISRRRGWVVIPTPDMREYVQAQLMTAAAGFMLGVSIGALLRGNRP
jgi:hypothetical protein